MLDESREIRSGEIAREAKFLFRDRGRYNSFGFRGDRAQSRPERRFDGHRAIASSVAFFQVRRKSPVYRARARPEIVSSPVASKGKRA
jgi:hypothetical protein